MSYVLSELTKYGLAAMMLMYAVTGAMVFRYRSERARTPVVRVLAIELFGVQALMFLQILLRTGEVRYLFFYAAEAVMILLTLILYRWLFPDGNRAVVCHMCMFLMIGVTMILRIDENKALKQMVIAAAGLAAGILVTEFIFRFDVWKRLTWLYAAAGCVMLLVVNILGSVTYGARMTFTVAGVTFMPTEIVKILFVFFLAGAFTKAQGLKEVLLTGVVAAVHVAILVLSRDLGSALILAVVYTMLVFNATKNAGYLLAAAVLFTAGGMAAYRLFGHVRVRVDTWADPFRAVDSGGYQITQSLFGVSAGGLFGFGLFHGMPQSIPFVEDDLIFSAIAEELGIIFALALLAVCLLTFLLFLYDAYRLRDDFYRLVTVGLAVTYIFQVFLTVGGSVKFIPLTGVTLPLVSYGGTSVLVTIVMFSIIEGVSRVRAAEHKAALERLHGAAAGKGMRYDREDGE